MSQQRVLNEQESKISHSSQAVSPASLTQLQENIKALLMSVTSGRSTGESLAKLNPDGSWAKMYQGYCQVTIDGSLETFSGTWPKWGTLLDGVCSEHVMSAPLTEGRCSKTLADTCSAGQQERNPSGKSDYTGHCSGSIDTGRPTGTAQCGLGGVSYGISAGMDGHRWPAGLGQPQYDWEPPRVATGIKNRTNRLKCLGNAVVPQQVYPILKAIYDIENYWKR